MKNLSTNGKERERDESEERGRNVQKKDEKKNSKC